jgi:DNA-binding SARP family transcriptional activator
MSTAEDRGASVTFGVLGPVTAWDGGGTPLALRGPRHRAVLARLLVARRHTVPVSRLVADLWVDPPPDAVGAVRTFVAALRRALEPGRPPRTPARLLVTEGPGYALRPDRGRVDAWRFEDAVASAAGLVPGEAVARLAEALGWWRGPSFADVAEQAWASAERARLAELRSGAVESLAEARLALGRPAAAVADLDAHVIVHPWRERAWGLLALALYRGGRQGDALAVLRRARATLVEQLGVDPGPELRRLESDILRQADHLDSFQLDSFQLEPGPGAEVGAAGRVWARAAAAYDHTVTADGRARLESTVGLLRTLAVTGGGGLEAARVQRVDVIAAAEAQGDPELTARVIGAYDVPAIWTRCDDPAQAAQVIASAERALRRLPPDRDPARARLLATVALESRGGGPRGRAAALEAERLARRTGDPAVLAFALNGVFMQAFDRCGLADRRDAIGAELTELGARHGWPNTEILGHLVRLQARCGLGDLDGADRHAETLAQLADRHQRPLVDVFTRWYGALRLAVRPGGSAAEEAAACRAAARSLDGAGMPGLSDGLLPLALLCTAVRHGEPPDGTADLGPYEPWARPLLLVAEGSRTEAAARLRGLPDPPPDLLQEAMWCLVGRAAIATGDRAVLARARAALAPAAAELAGAGSGLVTLGPVASHLADLDRALGCG